MKKITSIILALIISASVFSACGTESQNEQEDSFSNEPIAVTDPTPTPGDSKESPIISDDVLTIGDKITTADIEFELIDVTYGTNLFNFPQQDNYLYQISEEEAERASQNKAYKADEGEGYVVLVYNLKNTDSEDLLYKGNTVLKYKGEIYEEHPYTNSRFNVKLSDGFEGVLEYTFKPNDAYELRACYKVPYEILENESEPLEVIATFDKEYTFKVR